MIMTKHSVADGTLILIELILHSGRRISLMSKGIGDSTTTIWLLDRSGWD